MLDVKLVLGPFPSTETPALVTWVFTATEKPPTADLSGPLAELDRCTGGRLAELAESSELTGKGGETVLVHGPAGLKARRLFLLGAGKRDAFTLDDIRKLAGAAARSLKARNLTRFSLLVHSLPAGASSTEAAEAAVEGVELANFEPARYQTEKDEKEIVGFDLLGFKLPDQQNVEEGIRRGNLIGEAQNFARELVNEPANRLTPRMFAERTSTMAREAGLEVEVLDENRLRELKMGALLSVAQGSEEPPRMVVLTYRAPDWRTGQPVLGLVGKGITFDSGGISIKPSQGMEQMKYDMAGGASMVGALCALGRLKPRGKVIAVIPLSENLPSGRAQKPGDVQIAMSGKSIEVVNTDAEGRLVLADALHYARQLGATHLVDAATLTGAVVVALGHIYAGAFANDEGFLARFLASARAAGEKFWSLPVDDEYRDNITSSVADIQNTGKGRGAGAINGAMFLKEFVGDTPWVHLDIAGTAWLEEGKPWMAKGPTGIAVRTLVHLAERFGAGA